jgi:hypothetical protein
VAREPFRQAAQPPQKVLPIQVLTLEDNGERFVVRKVTPEFVAQHHGRRVAVEVDLWRVVDLQLQDEVKR